MTLKNHHQADLSLDAYAPPPSISGLRRIGSNCPKIGSTFVQIVRQMAREVSESSS
jgi:hypothetical protein